MTSTEKVMEILKAFTDEEMYEAIGEMTSNQKDVLVVSLIKLMEQQGLNIRALSMLNDSMEMKL